MADTGTKCVDGYEFVDVENGNIAREEIQRINYVSSKINGDNPEAVLSVYNKMIESNTFLTPVGLEYLRKIQNHLYKCADIEDSRIRDIPVKVSYTELNNQGKDYEEELRKERAKRRRMKTFKKEYKTSLLVNLFLVLIIIAMFIIVMKSDTPNMINYENAITNKYAAWEQELSEREAVIREKEADLLGE